MTNEFTAEVDALKAVLTALQPLSPESRARVTKYAIDTFDLQKLAQTHTGDTPPTTTVPITSDKTAASLTPIHIKTFKEEKKPRSANEMAAIVAFYLANLVPDHDKKSEVNTKDLETHFKIAQFKLPEQLKMTLANAANAGYTNGPIN